jgi:CMP-2-keto-3-deoxyoctulosonic acid synthetase
MSEEELSVAVSTAATGGHVVLSAVDEHVAAAVSAADGHVVMTAPTTPHCADDAAACNSRRRSG